MKRGDVWLRHLAYKIEAKHIVSYNCLFEKAESKEWDYVPQLTGFHPALIGFSNKIKVSLGVKREL